MSGCDFFLESLRCIWMVVQIHQAKLFIGVRRNDNVVDRLAGIIYHEL